MNGAGERPPGRAPLRRAGRIDLADGGVIVWSVAEGRRGRRWRSARRDRGGVLLSDLTIETGPDGAWSRLELATAEGVLTLHPEPDGRSAHGNVVTPGGVRHVALAWGPGWRLEVAGEPIVAVALEAAAGPPGQPVPGIAVGEDLTVRPIVAADPVTADAVTDALDGLPGPSWPLEDASAAGA